MAYWLGQLAGALIITGIIVGLAVRRWKRPMVVSAVVGVVSTLLYVWGSDGEFTLTYVAACAIWALFWSWRLSKLRPATSPEAKGP